MKEKKIRKSILIPVMIGVLFLAILWIIYEEKINVVEVVPVSVLRDDWWKEYDLCQGKVTNSMSQEIEPRNGKQIEDIFVEVGQQVKMGDKLLAFDMEEEEIDMELKKSEASKVELSLSKAKKKLAALNSETPVEDEEEGYTKAQLASLIKSKKEEIEELEMEYRQLELEYESMKKQIEEATVTATLDGVVQSINVNGMQTGEPILIVTGEDKLYVEGMIDEFSYHSVTAGTEITAVSWDTGNTFQARITEISDYPADQKNTLTSAQNPNVSYYPFKAVITDTLTEISAGETVNIHFGGVSSRIFLPLAYIRSENGKSYVYVSRNGKRLKRQEVTTGQSLYNTVIEITDGLEQDDCIAFPYGSHVREGANTVIADDSSDLVY